jgi:hypothetical protein
VLSTVIGLAPGNWAEWVGAIGTILAFAATSVAIWRSHRLRQIEHREAMYDQALAVLAQPPEDIDLDHLVPGTSVIERISKVRVQVDNASRREITRIKVSVVMPTGRLLGEDTLGFLRPGGQHDFLFDPVEGMRDKWYRIAASTTMSFEDIDGTLWTSMPNGRSFRTPLLPRWRTRKGKRHRPGPMLP